MEAVDCNVSRPILVQFDNGALKEDVKQDVHFEYYRSNVPRSNKRMLVAQTDHLTYSGPVIEKQSGLLKYYIGVVDRKSKRIEAIEQLQLCTLKPKLNDDQLKIAESPKTPASFKEQNESLTAAFGSSKQKRLLSSRKTNESVIESREEKVVDAVKHLLNNRTPPPKTPAPDAKFATLPPKNIDAMSINELYDVTDIINAKIYQQLLSHAKCIVDCGDETLNAWKDQLKFPSYILHLISVLPTSAVEREKKACYICYLNYLIALYTTPHSKVKSKDICSLIPDPLRMYVLNSFTRTQDKIRSFPAKYRDKLLCYMLVLSLTIEEYNVNCNLLMSDTKISVPRITKFLKAIGCSINNTVGRQQNREICASSITASLVLPRGKHKLASEVKKKEQIDVKRIKLESEN